MAQPPLSRQVAQLEKDIGVLLFDRSRSQIRLTQAGEVLLERSREILNRLESAYREAALVGKGGAGRLRIAFVGSATHGVLPNLIKSYRSHYPEVELALSAMNNAEQKRGLIQREIDIGVARPSLDDEEFRSALLHEEPLILAVPDNSPLNSQDVIVLKELGGDFHSLPPATETEFRRPCAVGLSQRRIPTDRDSSRAGLSNRDQPGRGRRRRLDRAGIGVAIETSRGAVPALSGLQSGHVAFDQLQNRQPLAACHEFF